MNVHLCVRKEIERLMCILLTDNRRFHVVRDSVLLVAVGSDNGIGVSFAPRPTATSSQSGPPLSISLGTCLPLAARTRASTW